MDYRDLLKRYIAHVDNCDGQTFLDPGFWGNSKNWTPEEFAELQKLDREGYEEMRKRDEEK